jgi:serine/threonine protein kinase
MPTKIGHFEIQSELAKSATGVVYKANDPQSGQTVALKAIRLSAFGESAADLQAALLAEAESTKSLSSPHLAPVFGAGEMEGQFCAAMEYVQGNSISTMLTRREGFSIWDLLDIGRQVCSGLDHAHAQNVFHYSLEPAKIMCGWDGTVKVLGFGVSSVGKFAPQTAELPPFLNYMSPEQVRGEAMDARSNLFSMGAMFYEMVTERKAFDGPDLDSLCQSLVEVVPIAPIKLNSKIHPLLSALIMKALEKDPAQRYQSGRDLLDDLEKCKESKAQPAKQPAQAPAPAVAAVAVAAKAAAQSKFVAPSNPKSSSPSAPVTKAPKAGAESRPSETRSLPNKSVAPAARAVAVASSRGAGAKAVLPEITTPKPLTISSVNVVENEETSAYLSAAIKEPVETFSAGAAKVAVDPMMAEGAGRGSSISFSEISELPPLKEVYVELPPPPPIFQSQPAASSGSTVYEQDSRTEDKPKVQPREAAQKAIKEIKSVPPRLILYSVGGAVALILVIGIILAFHIHSLNSEEDSGAARTPAATEAPAPVQPAPNSTQTRTAPAPAQTAQIPEEPAETVTAPPATRGRAGKNKKKTTAAPLAAPVIIPGQISLDSTPQGAQVQIDGRTDPSYVTPFLLPGVAPGQHTISVSKAGYSTDTRPLEVTSGNKTSLVVHLAQLMATLSVTSNPAGASVFIDGRDAGKITPAQINVDKGQHVVLVRKMGFLDETASPQFVLGQTVSLSPVLRPLGNAESLRTVGKMKKLFGGSGPAPGQVTVSIKTQPKGAQVTINQHMLEKGTPVEVALDPGNYEVDITLSGFAPIHKVITADKGSKLVVDEIMQRQ